MVRFYNPLLRHGELFFSISCEKLIQFLEVKLTKVWKVWARTHTHTHGVLALRFVHTEPLVIQQLVWVFLFQLWFLLLSLCSCKSKLLVFVCLSDLEGSLYALFFPLSYGSKKNCWFFSSFNFFTCCEDGWQLLSSLHGNQKPDSVVLLQCWLLWHTHVLWTQHIYIHGNFDSFTFVMLNPLGSNYFGYISFLVLRLYVSKLCWRFKETNPKINM